MSLRLMGRLGQPLVNLLSKYHQNQPQLRCRFGCMNGRGQMKLVNREGTHYANLIVAN